MTISELTVYDFLKEQVKLSDSDAKRYAKEISLAGERIDTRIEDRINTKFKESDYITKEYFRLELDARLSKFEVKIQKEFKETTFWLVGAMIGVGGLIVAIIKLL